MLHTLHALDSLQALHTLHVEADAVVLLAGTHKNAEQSPISDLDIPHYAI